MHNLPSGESRSRYRGLLMVMKQKYFDMLLRPRNRFEKVLIVALLFSWLPLLRFGFDSHHDGLIVSTINNLNFGESGEGRWPFNQYGPAWFILLKVISGAFPDNWLFMSLRLTTFLFYTLTFLFTYLFARKFLSQKLSLWTVLLLMLIQPFASDYNSDLIPWPSAFSMAMIPLSGFLLLQGLSAISQRRKFVYIFFVALSLSTVVMCRVQVGLLLTLVVLMIIVLFREFRILSYYIFSSICIYLTISMFLVHMGWLEQVFTDVFKFGSLYVTGDKSTLPKPIWTLLITILVFIVFELGLSVRIINKLNSRHKFFLSFVLIILVGGALLLLRSRGLNPVQILSVGFRRIWISMLIAVLISFLWRNIRDINWGKNISDRNLIVLVLFSGVAEIQVWPLFDQMHAWWSATPLIILLVIAVRKMVLVQSIKFSRINFIYYFTTLLLLATYSVTFFTSVSHTRVPLQVQGFSGVLISEKDGNEITAVNSFLRAELPRNSKVLNLCTNGDAFFSPDMALTTASRAFVFWTPMVLVPELRSNIANTEPDFIVTCSFVTNPIFYEDYSFEQKNLLAPYLADFEEANKFTSPNQVLWRVFSRIAQ